MKTESYQELAKTTVRVIYDANYQDEYIALQLLSGLHFIDVLSQILDNSHF